MKFTPVKYVKVLPVVVNWANRESRRLFQTQRPELDPRGPELISELKHNGIAFSSIEELFPAQGFLETFREFVNNLINQAETGHKKQFIRYLWGEGFPWVDLSNLLMKFSVEPKILAIAAHYLELWPKFVFSSANVTIPTGGKEAQGSQRWHRDPGVGDQRIFKMFVYLNDVDESAGPFQYGKATHQTGPLAHLFPIYRLSGHYPAEGEVERRVPKENIVSATGKAGTIIFCDTSGFHRGGYSTGGQRIMATSLYVSAGSLQKPRFKYPPDFDEQIKNLPAISQFAIKR